LPDLDPTDGCTVEKITYTDCSDNSNVVYYKVINGGHSWPGAGPAGYAVGNTNQDINASVEIWNFFKNYKLVTRPVVDFNGDGIVDLGDLVILIENWGTNESLCDIGPMAWGDGIVDIQDLEVLMSYWQQEILPDELIAYWKLDETEGSIAYDIAGGNDGTLNGEPAWVPMLGMKGGALLLDGIDDYVSTDFILNPGEGPFSVFAWVKGGVPGQVIISQTDVTVGRTAQPGSTWLGTDPSDGRVTTGLMDTFFGPLESESVITDGAWHHIGLVYDFDGFLRKLYVDGTEVAKDTNAVGGVYSEGGLYIGAGKNLDANSLFSGLIDDIHIYNQALDAEEIEALAR